MNRSKDALNTALVNVARHRDRFSGWGLVVSGLSFIAALWTTAPALDVKIPLVGGAHVGMNVGYVAMAGLVFIVFSVAWALGPLLSLRRVQEAVVEGVEAGDVELSASDACELLGPFAAGTQHRVAVGLTVNLRRFVYFVLPVLSALWIAETYFFTLFVYDRKAVVEETLGRYRSDGLKPSDFRVEPKERVRTVWLFSLAAPPADKRRFAIENGDLERPCAQLWVVDFLRDENIVRPLEEWERELLLDLVERTNDQVCVLDAFPRYELILNSVVNVAALVGILALAVAGWSWFDARSLASRLHATSVRSTRIDRAANSEARDEPAFTPRPVTDDIKQTEELEP